MDGRLFLMLALKSKPFQSIVPFSIADHGFSRYKDLSSDESLVYSVIESLGIAGAWVKTIKGKLNLHQKNVDQSIKTLLQRGYIKTMTSVKFPQRKMYILAGLQPGEDATGGAWFTDGVLDHELMDILAKALERRISQLSWDLVHDPEGHSAGPDFGISRKRKETDDGLDSNTAGKAKARRTGDGDIVLGSHVPEGHDHPRSSHEKSESDGTRVKKIYVPFAANYSKYPTLKYLTNYVNDERIVQTGRIPENNILQLLQVMIYDDRIMKVEGPPDESAATMYKARKNLAQLKAEAALEQRIRNTNSEEIRRLEAFRELEIKKLGRGGITEVPCARCPVFEMCEIGGPVNPENCEYFEEWFTRIESAEVDQPDGLTW
jgi:DNA-directed RNA polymerase III subunit RPC6